MHAPTAFIALLLFGATFAINRPHPKQKVVLTDLNGVPSIDASDLKSGSNFVADVKSKADVAAQVNNGGIVQKSWKVGVSDDKASAGQHYAGYKKTESDNSYSASDSNGGSGSIKTGKFGPASTFNANNNKGGSVSGNVRKTGPGFGGVNGQIDGSKPWDASWDGTFAKAGSEGNQVYVKESAPDTFDLRGPGEKGTAKKTANGVEYKDNRGLFLGREYAANIIENNDQRSKTEVRDKFGSFSDSKYIVETDKTKNIAVLSDKNDRIAEVEQIRAVEGPCDEDIYTNRFANDQFKIDEDSVKVEVIPVQKANGELSYEWPSCMDISMMVTLPEGLDVHNLAAQVEVSLPLRHKFYCADKYNCGSYNCFYKDLCNSQVNAALEKTVALNSILSNAENNACTAQNARKLPLKATVCPDDGATVPGEDKAVKPNFNILEPVYEDVEAVIKLYETKPTFTCNILSQLFNKPTQVACRKGSVSYKVTFRNALMFSNRDLNLNLNTTPKTPKTTKKPAPACVVPSWCQFFAFSSKCKC